MTLCQNMASARIPVRRSVGPLVWFLGSSDPEHQTSNLRMCLINQELPTAFSSPTGVQSTLNSHKWTTIWLVLEDQDAYVVVRPSHRSPRGMRWRQGRSDQE